MCIALTLGFLVLPTVTREVAGGPGQSGSHYVHARASPDWLSPDSATRLYLGFDVLVPTALPAPFSAEPSIMSESDWYSLYWIIPG
ncbi:MAG: hypothetical protein H0T49_09050, partial [Chloroflexia bacterium]|nr:hypothetical protein [Chloroflexia bacterium]